MNEQDSRIALVEKAFADFNAYNIDGVVGFIDPEVRTKVAGDLMNAGEWRGWDGFVQMATAWSEAWGQTDYKVNEIELVDERNLLAYVRQKAVGAGSGVPVEIDVVYLVEVVDERATRFEVYSSRESALAAVEDDGE